MMAEPKLPRGALKLAADAIMSVTNMNDGESERFECRIVATAALTAALEVIQRDALKQAAKRMLLLEAIAHGWACPACHGKPASTPNAREGRTGYTCGCGHSWEQPEPRQINYGMDPQFLLKRLARGEPLPDLPPRTPIINLM